VSAALGVDELRVDFCCLWQQSADLAQIYAKNFPRDAPPRSGSRGASVIA
jgi:hypothetical protein